MSSTASSSSAMPASTIPAAPDAVSAETAMMIAKVKRLMLIAGLTVSLGIGAVLFVISYRVFRNEGSVAISDVTATLPKGARIVSTMTSDDRLLATVDINGVTEIRSFDAKTLRPVGRLRFATEP